MNLSMRLAVALFVLAACVSPIIAAGKENPNQKITFKKILLDTKFRSEGVAVGDFNQDGKLDVAAGSVYYAAPDWKIVPVLDEPQEFDPKGYSNSFCNFSDDLNNDGWTDLVVVGFPGKETFWYENPQSAGGPWTRHVAAPVTNNESPQYVAIDNKGTHALLAGVNTTAGDSDGPDRQMAIVAPGDDPKAAWKVAAISDKSAPGTTKFSHGLGWGDVNGDGRGDVLVTEGWWEAPADASAPWKFHAARLGDKCAQMVVYDFDGDGDNDVLSSSAHTFGIWWHEQTPDGWKTHTIDKSFSQTHSLCVADINGDGLPDFVTGKRWWAHGGRDPGGDQPAVMFWYELSRDNGRPVWTAHQFDHDSGIGTQFEVADINGDGLLDVATANKKGVRIFIQQRE